MDKALLQRLLFVQTRIGRDAVIAVTGVSMNPTLYEGDTVTLRRCEDYAPGDILVFTYKTGELLIHRLMKKDERYYCKGDNAFRLEDVTREQIAGKVVLVNGKPPKQWAAWKIQLSFNVNRAFFACGYAIEKTRLTDICRYYENIILKRGISTMNYHKNESMDYIQTDETSLAVFDPESGDTHFFDEVGIDILNALSEPRNIDMLLGELCKIYAVSPEDIRADVEEFLADAIEKKVVCVA